jgi:hypothetical protein
MPFCVPASMGSPLWARLYAVARYGGPWYKPVLMTSQRMASPGIRSLTTRALQNGRTLAF